MNKSDKKILVSPSSFGKCGNEPIELLKKNGFEIIMNPYGRKLTAEEVMDLARDCVGIVAGVEPLNANVLDVLTNLKCISRCGSGMDSVDVKKAEELGIIVKNTPFGPTRAVSELTIGLVFDLLRQISLRDRCIRKGEWFKEMGFLLKNKKIGVLGLGRIGRTTAELLTRLDAKVYGFDIKPDEAWAKKTKITLLSFDELLTACDVLCIHVSAKSNGKYLIGVQEFEKMNKNSFLINVSRGGIVDEAALYNALKNGKILGAAVDVFEEEPYHGRLTELDNVILTPHVGSYAKEARLQMELEAVQNLINSLNKQDKGNVN